FQFITNLRLVIVRFILLLSQNPVNLVSLKAYNNHGQKQHGPVHPGCSSSPLLLHFLSLCNVH
ncbi:hypothetical protein WDU94_008366, partial [Cyamophila willieti]